MARFSALVAAAGRGTRAGLPYPKTLHPVGGVPILVRLLRTLAPYDNCPTVIVSPDGQAPVRDCLDAHGLRAHLVVQPRPAGMGDAVLRLDESPAAATAEHVLLAWGDLPCLQPATFAGTVEAHLARASDFTFPTRQVESAYTVVSRDARGAVTGVVETREQGITEPRPGEREIGLFAFRKAPVFTALREELDGKWGRGTGEHGFLYVIRHLAARGLRVEAPCIATELDLVSLNRLSDLEGLELPAQGS